MVSTRRTAPTAADPEMTDPELALKKKPIRKATAKKAAETETATKTKSSRGKKTEGAPVEEDAEAVVEEPKTRATRGRPRKNVQTAVEEERQPEANEAEKPAKATRATKSSTLRSKKAAVAVDEAPELPAPKAAKPARQTRAAASTAAPLSPKKITQMAKPSTRNTNSGLKSLPKAQPVKSSVRSKGTTRRRQVSDENADVPELAQPDAEEESVIVVSSTPVKKPVTRRQAAKEQEADASEVSMSTRDTTPTASPAQNPDRDAESDVEEPSVDLSTPEKQDQMAELEDSDDELCGPKTPMRRGSPGAEARYHSSAQRIIRKYNEEQPMQTPARRYAVLGSQRGTPQTQKPYCKPMPPSSEVRPMTVARGASRAFVFKDLRDGAPALPQNQPHQQHEVIAEEEDVSFIPDDNIISMDDEETAEITTPTGPAPVQLASPPTSITDVENVDYEQDDLSSVQGEEASAHGLDEDVAQEDPDATIITEEQDEDTEDEGPTQPEAESFETEDTVLITRPGMDEAGDVSIMTADDLSEDSVVHHEPAASDPETMVWENVQSEQTITVDFDGHLGEARSLPELEPTEVLDIASALDRTHEVDDAASDEDAPEPAEEKEQGTVFQEPLPAEDDQLSVPTPAVDLNDYFDMSALAEPTQVLDFAPQASEAVDAEMEDAALLSAPDVVKDVNEENQAAFANGSPLEDDATCDAARESDCIEGLQDREECDQLSQDHGSAIEEDEIDATIRDEAEQLSLPHYARSTFAFDARRKSLPATSMITPVKAGTRPNTSDGASMPRIANPFGQPWWARSRASSMNAPIATPFKTRHSAGNAGAVASGLNTPAKKSTPGKERYPVFAPRQNQVHHSQTVAAERFRDIAEKHTTRRRAFHRAISGKVQKVPTPVKPTHAAVATPVHKPKERYPALPSQPSYVDHSQTAAPPARFKDAAVKTADRRKTFHKAMAGKTQSAATPAKASARAKTETPIATPKDRYPALGSRTSYVDHAKTAAPPLRFQHPSSKPANRRETFHRAMPGKAAEKKGDAEDAVDAATDEEVATPKTLQTPTERFPRLRPRADYQDHAKTIAAPRFQTPPQGPLKRPATTQKPSSIRKAALRNSAATPMKTPLKAPAMTPGQEPMTPHPAAPLRGVLALVEVYTLEGASASAPFVALLHRLGAKTTRAWTDRVTHVVFKDGSPTTLQRVRLHNKDVAASGKGTLVACVNSRWVSDCDVAGAREDETDEAYAVDVEEVPRGGKRRRKSMEPSALMNLGGNVVRDRKASLGRSSLGRSSMRLSESPAKKAKLEDGEVATPGADASEDKENSDEEPATPAWIAQPDKLVQQTAPMKRVRKLELQGAKSRRLTFWDGRD